MKKSRTFGISPITLRAGVLFLGVMGLTFSSGASGVLQMRNGYFWDPAIQQHYMPRGIAYQTWNPPVGADQTIAQVEYDLKEFRKLHVNSVRAEFVWNQIEKEPGIFDFTKADYLVAKAEELGLRLFILIGSQYAPAWFPGEWRAVNEAGQDSVVLNYEHPEARRAYSNFIHQVTARYRDSGAVGAWILGNEYAYFDLWNPDHRYLGYDPHSLASYRRFLAARYGGNIQALNATWGTSHPGFDAVPMFQSYPADRRNPGFHDLIQWREQSVGDFVALGAVAAQQADPNHLRTYSMIGALFISQDAKYTCENARAIVGSCAAAGAPLHFWSINNYPWATMDTEVRSGDYGIAKHQAESGLPVFLSETGHSETDDQLPDAAERKADALPGQMWEALMSGAIGTHIFTWNDRNLFNGYYARERGFGIVRQNRTRKQPLYDNVAEMFRRMENLKVERLFCGSSNPAPDLQFFWPESSKLVWPTANVENAMLWSALKRLGFQPGILFDEGFQRGDYTNAAAILLSRCFQMTAAQLDLVATEVAARGIHVHANADLPGQFDTYGRPNANWAARMSQLFGLNVAEASIGWDSGVTHMDYHLLLATGAAGFGPLPAGSSDNFITWKIWHGLAASSGTTLVTHTGNQGTRPAMPALQIKSLGAARTAINTFALGDIHRQSDQPPTHDWDVRYNWLRAIYRDHFALRPLIDLSGPGASYVTPDYRRCANGSLLISLLNCYTNRASVTVSAPALLAGKTVENLLHGGVLQTNSSGTINLDLASDEFVLLYVYQTAGGTALSLINSNRNKLWIQSAPAAVWPNHTNAVLTLGYDAPEPGLTLGAGFERVSAPGRSYARAPAVPIVGSGTVTVALDIPDADLADPAYGSSPAGARYIFRAWLDKGGTRVSETSLPVRLLWGVRPLGLPPAITPGATYPIAVEWQELPAWLPSEAGLPVDRAGLWEPYQASRQYYRVVLQLHSGGQVVAEQDFLTNAGSGQHTFAFPVPAAAAGPFTWSAFLQAAPEASHDMLDSFEDRTTGAEPALFGPWQSYVYSELGNARSLAEGVDSQGFDGKQAVFMVVTNPPNPGSFSGFGLSYVFPRDWALPHDVSQWRQYTFACNLRETLARPCVVEFQIKDARGGQLHCTVPYAPGEGQWAGLKVSLDEFFVPRWIGRFDPAQVHEIVVNIQMLQTSAVYQCSIDNIRFDGPETPAPMVAEHEVWEGFDGRDSGVDPPLPDPWDMYVYSENGVAGWLVQGISSQAANGGQAAFVVVTNPPNAGAYSGFGLYYAFTNAWSLPADTNLWANYRFSFDFKEISGRRCVLEMQVKSGANHWIEFIRPYLPGSNGWDTIGASLSQFVAVAGGGVFDPAKVQAVTVNIRMLETNAVYQGFFDNIHFAPPGQPAALGARYAGYSSADDSARMESIRLDAAGAGTVSWWGAGTLQTAPAVTGPWSDAIAGTNSFRFIRSAGQQFFRLRR